MKNFKYLLVEAKIRLSNFSKIIFFYFSSDFLSAKFMCVALLVFLGHKQMCSEKLAKMHQTHLSVFEWSLHSEVQTFFNEFSLSVIELWNSKCVETLVYAMY